MTRTAIWATMVAATTWAVGGCAEADGARAPEGGTEAGVRGELKDERVRVGRLERTFSVYVPARVATSAPVVVALHGGSGGSGARIRGFIGSALEELADDHGFLVAYPDGFGGSWNDCRADATYPAKVEDVDDPAFLGAVVSRLRERYGADRGRVFALGYSNGAHLAYRVALESPGLVRAVAAFGANLPAAGALDCRETGRPGSVLVVNGTSDGINPFGGGEVVAPDGTRLGRVRSALETAEYFAGLAGLVAPVCEETVLPVDPETGLGVTRTVWRTEAAGGRRTGEDGPGDGSEAAVELVTIQGGGHTIPGPRSRFPEFVGPVESRYDGVGAAVSFFLGSRRSPHRRPPSPRGDSDEADAGPAGSACRRVGEHGAGPGSGLREHGRARTAPVGVVPYSTRSGRGSPSGTNRSATPLLQ